jgi:TusA-related sulfurtransferase
MKEPLMSTLSRPSTRFHWNAENAACAQLAIGLRRELARVPAAELISISANGAGAAADIAAWCRMTGHRLIKADHPHYLIQKQV